MQVRCILLCGTKYKAGLKSQGGGVDFDKENIGKFGFPAQQSMKSLSRFQLWATLVLRMGHTDSKFCKKNLWKFA